MVISGHNLLQIFAIGTFTMGVITLAAGVMILLISSLGKDMRAVSTQTAQIAQKGIAEEISGLVGNASNFLLAMNEMVRTVKGTGIFLTVLGLILILTSFWLALQIH